MSALVVDPDHRTGRHGTVVELPESGHIFFAVPRPLSATFLSDLPLDPTFDKVELQVKQFVAGGRIFWILTPPLGVDPNIVLDALIDLTPTDIQRITHRRLS